MKNLSLILFSILVVLASCTKSNEVHPELGDGNEEFLTVGTTTAHVEYSRADMAEQQKVVFHYCLSGVQQFTAAEMAKKEEFFELTLNDLVSDTLYHYYYEVFPNSGDVSTTEQKTFRTLAVDTPLPPIPPAAELPAVATAEVSEITANSAQCGGEVTDDGGSEVTERGVCWSTNANPTLNDSHIASGTGIGSFTAVMNGLETNTTYHVRAYAKNEKGTAYGIDREFTTISGGGIGDAPIGAVNGLFTINANGDQVYFSQGNLQYQASTNTWRFAEHQWDYVGTHINVYAGSFGGTVDGSDNLEASVDYNGWIDIYNWGTSGYSHGSSLYHPWSVGGLISNYNAYGGDCYNLYDQTGQADWGYNAISNGGITENQWRTLKIEEWDYILNVRTTPSGVRFVRAKVNGVSGMVLFPDNWNSSLYVLNSINFTGETSYDENTISGSDWNAIMEPNGVIFLPAGGVREGSGTSLGGLDTAGWYWSSSCRSSGYAYHAFFSWKKVLTDNNVEMWHGHTVRLVQDANK